MVKKKKIVVLGGFGFLGKQVVNLLNKNHYDIEIFSRRNGIDMLDLPKFTSQLKSFSPDVLINCAAHVGSVHYVIKYPADLIRDNMLIINNIYETVKLVSPKTKIINPVSNCSYPGDANIHYEPDWQKGSVHDSVLPFASTRRMIYAYALCYFNQFKIKSVNWFVANAYGPGDYFDPNKVHALNGIIIRLIKAQRNKDKTFEIWGSGKPIREWVYVEDVAKMIIYSININQQIYPINLAQNKAYSIKEIAEIAANELNYKVKFVFNTKFPDGAMFKILDNRQFKKLYPKWPFTKLAAGIKNTINYYKKSL